MPGHNINIIPVKDRMTLQDLHTIKIIVISINFTNK